MIIHPGPEDHEKFQRLCALAVAGILAPLESVELQAHLKHCETCHQVYRQYQMLTTEGMVDLAEEWTGDQEQSTWNTTPVLEQVLARIQNEQTIERKAAKRSQGFVSEAWQSKILSLVRIPVTAGVVLALTYGAFRAGVHYHKPANSWSSASESSRLRGLADEKQHVELLLAAETSDLTRLQADRSDKERELARIRQALRELEDRSNKLQTSGEQSQSQVLVLTGQRDALRAQLQELTKAYESDKAELSTLRAERDGMLQRNASLEARVADLGSLNREQDRRLKDAEQYLTSDRDIRELMGARKLYIADVFDVDGSSRTQKPFGRVFYTKGKSLIFYAFDLDRQPKVVNATFQVWGQREAPQGEQAVPMNLGILYMDNEANRRWVMRFDDPKQLSEIDAVFVTVEPRGGSQKPTSKPFLYALLRNEANHP